MHLATLVCFCISTASAVKHYGLTPTMEVQNMVEKHALGLSGIDVNLTSLFMTDHHNSHDGADFLAAELGIFNKTIAELFPSTFETIPFKPELLSTANVRAMATFKII